MEIFNCRHCDKLMRFQSLREVPYFPFCSERCKLIDLDKWLTGEHRIPIAPEDREPQPPPPADNG